MLLTLLTMLQQPAPDSPFKDVLGWVIVFFVIVWPILRGLMDTARKQRKEFEDKQANAGPPAPARNRRRRTLEEILEGKLERPDRVDPPPLPRRPVPAKPGVPARVPGFGERPANESLAPVYDDNDLVGNSTGGVDLVGDPFDESSMELDLVPDAKLRHIPDEDEIEAGAIPMGPTSRINSGPSVAARPLTRIGVPALSDATPIRDDPEVIFRRLPRPLTPWQKAVVLREVLGPPHVSRDDLF